MSQEKLILDHLLSGKTLEPLQALDLYGCWALSSRISDINRKVKEGTLKCPPVLTKMVEGNGKSWARYYIEVFKTEPSGQLSLI